MMGAIEEAATAILNWITASRLRTVLIAIVLFGVVTAVVDENGWVGKDLSHTWFVLAYAAAVLAALFLVVAAGEIGVAKGGHWLTRRGAARAMREERLANFAALDEVHKRCFVYLKQRDRQRFIEQGYAILNNLVNLQLLNPKGGAGNARSYEVPQEIWDVMHQGGWGDNYPRLEREPWDPEVAWANRRV
jgi:hypothetical protein